MKRRGSRRRGFLSWGILFGGLLGATGVSAWKFEWIALGGGNDAAARRELAGDESHHERVAALSGESAVRTIHPPEPFHADAERLPPGGWQQPDQPREFPVQPAAFPPSDPDAGPLEFAAQPSGPGVAEFREGEAEPQFQSGLRTAGASAIGNNTGAVVPAGAILQVSNEQPEPAPPPDALAGQLRQVDRLIETGDVVAAHRELSTLYWNRPEFRPQIQSRIESTARSLFFDPQPHYLEPHTVEPGDQMRLIARKYGLSWEYLAQLNRVDPSRIRAGQRLKVNYGPFAAVVDLSDFVLTVHAQGYYIRRYRIGIGKDNSTPLGKFKVLDKVVDPQYTDPDGRVFAADDPTNPIGERWLALGQGYGIHGTIEPDSIGRAESRGCIRLKHDDVVEVYDLLTVGSEVVVER